MPLFYRNLGKWLTSLFFFFCLAPLKNSVACFNHLAYYSSCFSIGFCFKHEHIQRSWNNEWIPSSFCIIGRGLAKFSLEVFYIADPRKCVLVVNKKPFSTLYCKSKTEVVTQAYLSKSKYYQGSMRSPAKKTNDLKYRKTRVNMSSLAVFLVCPFSKNVLNTSTLNEFLTPKACLLVWNLTDDVSFPVLIQHSCPGKAVLFRFFYFMFQTQGSVTLENNLIRVELVRGGLVRSLVHKASGR